MEAEKGGSEVAKHIKDTLETSGHETGQREGHTETSRNRNKIIFPKKRFASQRLNTEKGICNILLTALTSYKYCGVYGFRRSTTIPK